MAKPLPPFGKKYIATHPDPGMIVALGGDAWAFAARSAKPVLVLPGESQPDDYRWPDSGHPVLIHERGQPDDERLKALAAELLIAGVSCVVALRYARLNTSEHTLFFYPESPDVA